jgi:hypothetical protein
MRRQSRDKNEILDAIKYAARELGKCPSRAEFIAHFGITEYQVLKYFPSWNSAVAAAGLEADTSNIKLNDAALLEDWGNLVRKLRQIPTRTQYRHHGNFGSSSFDHHFGPWSQLPDIFRQFAEHKPEWNDVLALLPVPTPGVKPSVPVSLNSETAFQSGEAFSRRPSKPVHAKLENRPVYGNHLDFRGLRHEPVNENGVIFLFGIVARELGYSVEAVQQGFPDCEAKRLVGVGKWQRARIEFEYESRNFRDHGHPVDGCDVIVCWRHNWPECPEHIEVLELSEIINQLGKSEE